MHAEIRIRTDLFLFFFNDPAPTEIYTLSLHDALPICRRLWRLISATAACSDSPSKDTKPWRQASCRSASAGAMGRTSGAPASPMTTFSFAATRCALGREAEDTAW